MDIINAKDAAMMMPRNSFRDAVIRINEMIKSAAMRDQSSVRVDFLADIRGDSVTITDLGKKVLPVFEAKGFKVLEIYDCGQFVDVGVALSWRKKVTQPDQ